MGFLGKLVIAALCLCMLAVADVYVIVYFWPSLDGFWLKALAIFFGVLVFGLVAIMALRSLGDNIKVD